jgi:hypothetical protein
MINNRICGCRGACPGDCGDVECLGCPSSVFQMSDYAFWGWDDSQGRA